MSKLVDEAIAEQRQSIAPVGQRYTDIDTAFELQRMLHLDACSDEDDAFLEQAMRRVDIGNRLFAHYTRDWLRQPGETIGDPWLAVLALLIYRYICRRRDSGVGHARLLKPLNCLLKCIDLTASRHFAESSPLRQEIESLLDSPPATVAHEVFRPEPASSTASARDIELTVLFHEGPIARAYLETLRSMGLRPKRIINLIATRDIATRKPVGRFLPAAMRRPYAASIQQRKIHYWPQQIRRTSPELYTAISDWVTTNLGFERSTLDAASTMSALSDYSDRVDDLLVTGLGDPLLYEVLNDLPDTALLFTGGGIVPESLLSIASIRLLHVHPGFLPDIRGADCMLWSVLLTGAASASSFYLAPGIDTGDIVTARWLPAPRFEAGTDAYPGKTLYRAICSWYDPWLRAAVLRETIRSHDSYFSMPSIEQNETSGTQFHFMHDKMRGIALKLLFRH